ncbi:hypothetical protein FACS189464_1170 [Bacteroidia bacterium]|nr:hypothetical protein FACS189464_1170 [Bacteroidia bacterium]
MDRHYLYNIDSMYRVKHRLDAKKFPYDIEFGVYQPHFFQNDENLLYMRTYCDTIFIIDASIKMTPKYHLNFGNNWYTSYFFKKYYRKQPFYIYQEMDANHYAKFLLFSENESYLIVGYTITDDSDEKRYMAIYSRETDKVYTFKGTQDFPAVHLFSNPHCLKGNAFVSIIEADQFCEIAAQIKTKDTVSETIKQYAKIVKDTDNPILILYSIHE